MAQIKYRGNLSAKWFPFISEWFGRSVIVQAQDQNFNRQLTSEEDLDKDRGIPQVYYCHNVMPSAQGLQSVGYVQTINGSYAGMSSVVTLRANDGTSVLYCRDGAGNSYICPYGSSSWTPITTPAGCFTAQYTIATINGQTYIMYAYVGLYTYTAGALTAVPFLGLTASLVLGITANNGYMIAYSTTYISWSSTLPPTTIISGIDFTPSQITGAGGGNVQAVKGQIALMIPHFLGFIIYTNVNAVAAVYSGNINYPYNFREVVGSGGMSNNNFVDYDPVTGNHYAYTTSGMQIVSISATQTVMPEATDFLAGRFFEDFDEATKVFSTQSLNSPMKKAISVIADRCLVMSYGVNSLTHALVYDVVLKRYGKLRINHTDCFEYRVPVPEQIDNPRASLAFLNQNGTVNIVDFTYASAVGDGVLLLGKYQFEREHLLQLQEVHLENIRTGNSFQLYDCPTLDGKNLLTPIPGILQLNNTNYRKYLFHVSGVNHSLMLIGNFYLDSVMLAFNTIGQR